MKSKETLFKALYWALTEIRADALETQNNGMYAFVNSLNNVPLKLLKAKTREDYDKILTELDENVKLKKFLDDVKSKID